MRDMDVFDGVFYFAGRGRSLMKGLIKKIIPDDVFRSLLVALKSAFFGRPVRFFKGVKEGSRRPFLRDEGRLCKGCGICEKVCPSHALSVESSKHEGQWGAKALVLDPSRCVLCGLCIEACPYEALSPLFECDDPIRHRPVGVYLKRPEAR